MKKLLFIAIIIMSVSLNAQIVNQNDTTFTYVGYQWERIEVINYFVTDFVPANLDTIVYTFEYTPIVLHERFDTVGYVWIGDTCYLHTKRAKTELSHGRRILLYQYVKKYVNQITEEDNTEKMIRYLNLAKDAGVSNVFFLNHELVHPIIYPGDTLP